MSRPVEINARQVLIVQLIHDLMSNGHGFARKAKSGGSFSWLT
jgi:hypothetical protein